MSASLSVQIADEVVALLTGAASGTFTPAITVARRYAPYVELAKLTGVQVSVVPMSKEQIFTGRKFIAADHDIKIVVQSKLAKAEDATAIDPLTALVEAIEEYLAGDDESGQTRRLLPTTKASLMKLAGPVLYTADLVSSQTFNADITATYHTEAAFR
ncbi:MAG TPA: hypothetical protein VHQ47_17900 [Phycisphaerae bacterium]|jgi:hypothetical protein|nr:hypothetical protein [Phycisphaerae bacterium]